MGVYHFTALGLSPGAVTLPLSTVYALLVGAYIREYKSAQDFFRYSGERNQEMKGGPETLVIFTTKEILGTENKNTQVSLKFDVRSNLFGKVFQKGISIPKVIGKYLGLMYDFLEKQGFSPFYNGKWIKHIYLVQVEHKDYSDAFHKIGVTMMSHRDKEVWINMIAGTNQQTIAMLNTGLFFGTATRYYYIFQENEAFLDSIYLKKDITEGVVERLLQQWNSLPIFFAGRYGFFIELVKKFKEFNNAIPESILKETTREYDVKLEKLVQYLHFDKEKKQYYPTKELENIISLYKEIIQKNITNHSEWKKWCAKERLLYELDLDGNIQRIT